MTQIYRTEASLTPIERAAKPIWEALFEISVPYKDTVSEQYARLFGMPTVGDAAIDADMHNQPIYTYATINKMVEYHKLGVVVKVINHADTKRIYDIINAYLLIWKNKLENGINIGNAPIDDLVLLDRFASVVYEHAVQHFRPDLVNSLALNGLSGNGMWKSRESLVKPEETPVNVEPTFTKRETLATYFSGRIMRGRGPAQGPTPPAGEVPPPSWMRRGGNT